MITAGRRVMVLAGIDKNPAGVGPQEDPRTIRVDQGTEFVSRDLDPFGLSSVWSRCPSAPALDRSLVRHRSF